MALKDARLAELAALVDRGETVPAADAHELVCEVAMWRSRFCEAAVISLKDVKAAADRCVYDLSSRVDRLAQHNRELARRAAVAPPDSLDYPHDEDLCRG